MIRKFMVAAMLSLAVLMVLLSQTRVGPGSADQPEPTISKRHEEFKTTPLPASQDRPVPAVVHEINAKNAKVNTFVCEDLEIKLWEGGRRHRVRGEVYYEKPKNFRLILSSILGKEIDLGSNATHFWYWSKRDKEPGLHFARHEDFPKTRLKTPFNPMLMRAALGAEILDTKNCKIVENQQDIMLVYSRVSGSGRPVQFSVFVSKAKKQIDGFLLSDEFGKRLATCEIRERKGDVPVEVMFTWHEENRVMLMRFNGPKVNGPVNARHWTMPAYSPKIDMAEK
jgi:hypothetical protein